MRRFHSFIGWLITEQKEKLSEVEQQLKKAEAAQRRRMQSEKAAREAEVCLPTMSCFMFIISWHFSEKWSYIIIFQAEAIRKILGLDSGRKKKEDKMKKQRDELAQVDKPPALFLSPARFLALL